MHCSADSRTVLPAGAFSKLWTRANREFRTRHSPEALHATGLLELLGADSAGKSDQPISSLQSAARSAPGSSAALADLSAAYLVRAERTQNARDVLEAIEAADQALAIAPRDPAAGFNLALSLEWLGVDGQASAAWERYLGIDSTSGWAEEGKLRLAVLRSGHEDLPPPSSAASRSEMQTYVARAPQEERLYGWDRLLGEWGDAMGRGDRAGAAERLRLAQSIGEALERGGRDATLSDAIRAIHAAAKDPAATLRLARAHAKFAAGQAAYHDVDYVAARIHFDGAVALQPPSPPLRRWATVFHSLMLAQGGKAADAEDLLRPLIERTDTLRYPALAGRARWVLAMALLRDGEYERAMEMAQDAERLFGRAGEHEHQGGVQYVVADARYFLGATLAAHEAAHRALSTLRRHHRSVWLLNTLSVAARTAEADGLRLAALRLHDERVSLADRIGHPARRAEARLGRARLLTAAGMHDRAGADIGASLVLVRDLKAGDSRSWLETELGLARADFFLATDPARAAKYLDVVLERPLTANRRLRARVGRAEARLALGDTRGAEADLNSASALLAREHDAIVKAELRASLLDAARGVFDRLALLSVASGDTIMALEYLERGRTSFGPNRRMTPQPVETQPAEGRWRLPAGEVAVEYALIGDTLLAWTVSGSAVRLTRRKVDRAALLGTIDHVRSSMERGKDEDGVRHGLTTLYDWLVRPVETRLGGAGTTLVLIADGELAAVPFSALYDARRERHLVEAHPLRYAGSLRDAKRARHPGPPRSESALLVADPAFDARAHAGLPRLPAARAEVDSIAAGYSRPVVLTDAAAASTALRSALERAGIVHFAGHAVFDDQRPDRSFLVLAPERGRTGPAWLTAAEMEALPLRNVDVFVLSACRTLRSRNGRSGGFAGFAGALLNAGAGGVVGSLWAVGDELTAPLMVGFHREYLRSGDGPRALREAQLRLLRSSDPDLSSPAAWAGFRYAGS